jgi:hypothetical protein
MYLLAGFPTWLIVASPFIVVVGAAIPYAFFFWVFRRDEPMGDDDADRRR